MAPLANAAISGEVAARLPKMRARGPPATAGAIVRAMRAGGASNPASAAPMVSRMRRLAWRTVSAPSSS